MTAVMDTRDPKVLKCWSNTFHSSPSMVFSNGLTGPARTARTWTPPWMCQSIWKNRKTLQPAPKIMLVWRKWINSVSPDLTSIYDRRCPKPIARLSSKPCFLHAACFNMFRLWCGWEVLSSSEQHPPNHLTTAEFPPRRARTRWLSISDGVITHVSLGSCGRYH